MKTAFITGGATGIGAATVKKFIAEGMRVGYFDTNLEDAEKLGADAVINIRMTTSVIMQGAAEILVYGTAVKLK